MLRLLSPPRLTSGTLHSPSSLLLGYTTDLSHLEPPPLAGQGCLPWVGGMGWETKSWGLVLVGEVLCTCCSHLLPCGFLSCLLSVCGGSCFPPKQGTIPSTSSQPHMHKARAGYEEQQRG